MVAGDRGYSLNLSRLAYSFQGAISIEYLEAASVRRVRELSKHSESIAREIEARGK